MQLKRSGFELYKKNNPINLLEASLSKTILLFSLLLLIVNSAYGAIGTRLSVIPGFPVEDRSFEAEIPIGAGPNAFCINPFPNVQNERFDVSVENNTVILDVSIEDVLTVCVPGLPPLGQRYPIQGLPEGNYELIFNTVFPDTTFPAEDVDRTFRASLAFEVLPGPEPVPALSTHGLICLLLAIFVSAGFAVSRLRRHAPSAGGISGAKSKES